MRAEYTPPIINAVERIHVQLGGRLSMMKDTDAETRLLTPH